MKLGCVNYINAFPFTLPLKEKITTDIPTALSNKLRDGTLDAALTSCVTAFDEGYDYLPNYGIAAQEEILSVNLYTRLPPTQLSGHEIGLTSHSSTSVELLRILCTHHWAVSPHFAPLSHDQTAFLLIGDPALKQPTISGYQTIDLAQAWYEMTQFPFVFALFMSPNANLPPLSSLLEEALVWSECHLEEVVAAAHKQTGCDHTLLQKYYALCHTRLSDNELQGLHHFQSLRHVSKVLS